MYQLQQTYRGNQSHTFLQERQRRQMIFRRHIKQCQNSNATLALRKWCTRWRPKINDAKSKNIFSSKRMKTSMELQIKDKKIPYKRSVKYLVVVFENRMSWCKQQKHPIKSSPCVHLAEVFFRRPQSVRSYKITCIYRHAQWPTDLCSSNSHTQFK